MKDNKADVIFHPVRIRIVQALFGGRRLTAQQLVEELGGASIATLYRHLNRLVQAEVVAVVEERPIRGAVEKVYALANNGAANFSAEEVRQTSREDQRRHFTTFIGTLLNDYGRVLDQEHLDLAEEGIVVRQESYHLTNEEARQVSGLIREALAPFKQNPPDADHRRRLLTLILLPDLKATNQIPDSE